LSLIEAPLPARARKRVVAKNKLAPPFTEAEFEIRWGTGIDTLSELLDLGVARGLIEKASAASRREWLFPLLFLAAIAVFGFVVFVPASEDQRDLTLSYSDVTPGRMTDVFIGTFVGSHVAVRALPAEQLATIRTRVTARLAPLLAIWSGQPSHRASGRLFARRSMQDARDDEETDDRLHRFRWVQLPTSSTRFTTFASARRTNLHRRWPARPCKRTGCSRLRARKHRGSGHAGRAGPALRRPTGMQKGQQKVRRQSGTSPRAVSSFWVEVSMKVRTDVKAGGRKAGGDPVEY
jgi:hypothetical protein